jgi:hypothetical protein
LESEALTHSKRCLQIGCLDCGGFPLVFTGIIKESFMKNLWHFLPKKEQKIRKILEIGKFLAFLLFFEEEFARNSPQLSLELPGFSSSKKSQQISEFGSLFEEEKPRKFYQVFPGNFLAFFALF